MAKLTYNIEGNINFQDELKKLLNEDQDDIDENVCQISGCQLTSHYVTLECNHRFNYGALFKELMVQRYKYNNYNVKLLSSADRTKFINSNAKHFIRCPYCRNIQFTILPYYKELEYKKEYGVNSLDPELHNPLFINETIKSIMNGQILNLCGFVNNYGDTCIKQATCTIPNTTLHFCYAHYNLAHQKYKLEQKAKDNKEKEAKMMEKKKLLEELNAERESKGLKPLKRLPAVKAGENSGLGCSAILKSGVNKGKQCGCVKIEKDGLCKRHINKV